MRRCIALEFVRNKLPRRFALSLQHFAKEPFGSPLVPTLGHQDVENITVLINSSPQVDLPAVDLQEQSSRAGESHPHALTDPDVNLSIHPALIAQPAMREGTSGQKAPTADA